MPDRLVGDDPVLRKRLFVSIGRPGVVLVDGVVAGLWKGRKKGRRLEVGVEWLGAEADIAEEAAALASLRGCDDVRVL